jgi:hypothetical protein
MNRTAAGTAVRNIAAAALAAVVGAACYEGRGSQDPSQQQQQYDPNNPYAQQPGYGPPGTQGQYPPGTYPPQQQYPQQQYPQQQGAPVPGQYPQSQPTATAPANPLALPCQNDLICGTHKCNLVTQRCAFPCTANAECAAGFTCMGAGGPTALCVPGAQ